MDTKQLRLALALLALALPAGVLAQSIPVAPMATPAQTDAIPLDTGTVPGSPGEAWFTLAGNATVRNVAQATLTPVLPDKATATGAAVIIAPGGGFMFESMDAEAYRPARSLADHGIAAFVLKYRLAPMPADLEAYKKAALARAAAERAMGAKEGARIPATPLAIADAQAAMRLVRARATQWGIDPHRVGFLGFSAGAITGVSLVEAHAPGTEPDLLAAIYPAMGPANVPADAPPLFVAIAGDDELFARQGYGLPESWRHAGHSVELHVYEHGGHGFGLKGKTGTTSTGWSDALLAWLTTHGWLTASAPPK